MAKKNSQQCDGLQDDASSGPDLSIIAQAVAADEGATDERTGNVIESAELPVAETAGAGDRVKARNGTASAGARRSASRTDVAVQADPVAAATPSEPAAPEQANSEDQSSQKDFIMAEQINDTIDQTAQTQTGTMHHAAQDMQDRFQSFYARSNTVVADMAELSRGNVEAIVEAGRIWSAGLQDLGRATFEETRGVYEGMTDDVKRMAAVKSPTELMQLQSEVARRNLDVVINQASKNTEAMLKLVNDVFAPVSTRMSVAMEKLSKAA